MPPRPLGQPLAPGGLGRVPQGEVVELALEVFVQLARGLVTVRILDRMW